MGDWKLIYDMMGYGQLYHVPSDSCELKNLFGQPHAALILPDRLFAATTKPDSKIHGFRSE